MHGAAPLGRKCHAAPHGACKPTAFVRAATRLLKRFARQGEEGRFSLRSTCCDCRKAVLAIVSGTMIPVDVLLDGGNLRGAGRGAALVSDAGSVGLAAGFAAWICGFGPVSRTGLLCAEAGAKVGAGAMAVTGALSSSFPSTTIGAVRCAAA